MINKLEVAPTASANYDIIIDSELDFSYIHSFIKGKQVLIVTNDTIDEFYLELLSKDLKQYIANLETVVLKDGEIYKSQQSLDLILNKLLEKNFTRVSTVLVALGGGVVGDITGFAASIYQRGVPFVQIPTTLLSQVDSSVGGKTAINHLLGKNMIGSFYQPKLVYTSPRFYQTLPQREFIAGLAEVVKYGFISSDFYEWLQNNMNAINLKDSDTLIEMIKRSCSIKAQVVAVDEHDITGHRAVLNFGHTFGHAIEKCQGYIGLKHGEAVGVGMCMAAEFSNYLGIISKELVGTVISFIKKFNIPTNLPEEITQADFFNAMLLDKKNDSGKLKFILMHDIGLLKMQQVNEADVIDFLKRYF